MTILINIGSFVYHDFGLLIQNAENYFSQKFALYDSIEAIPNILRSKKRILYNQHGITDVHDI